MQPSTYFPFLPLLLMPTNLCPNPSLKHLAVALPAIPDILGRPPRPLALLSVEELEIRRAQVAVAREMEAKDAAERERLASLQKQLKGRDYGYDHKGQVRVCGGGGSGKQEGGMRGSRKVGGGSEGGWLGYDHKGQVCDCGGRCKGGSKRHPSTLSPLPSPPQHRFPPPLHTS